MLSINEIKQKKVSGDFVTASKMLGITPESVRQSLNKEGCKNFEAVCKAMTNIITERERLINNTH